MSKRTLALLLGLCALAPAGAVSVAAPRGHTLSAQRSAQRGPRTCNTDADCASVRVPRPRNCPAGGQSVATACCRMNYCGICWSDCPPATR